jgi:hypothetical protein
MGLLNETSNTIEDMLRWKQRWIRLGEKLHPGEYSKEYPKVVEAFGVLRNDVEFSTFNSIVEKAFARKDLDAAMITLIGRPGEFARRLDQMLRMANGRQSTEISDYFSLLATQVSTPVLLQVRQHFISRNNLHDVRVFFPKGNLAKAKAINNNLTAINSTARKSIITSCDNALKQRFSRQSALGKVYIDENLRDYVLPFSQRSASSSMKTVVRGSRMKLDDKDTLRFFVWWKNGSGRTDIDLSATLLDEDLNYTGVLSYYNLKDFGGCHSGDIVDAPNGASEFIDVSLSKLRKAGVRYVAMTLHSYTSQKYSELPECFAGWMSRENANSGEVFEPKTVQNKLDITAQSQIALPLIIDVVENAVIWCDLSMKRNDLSMNNVSGNLSGIQASLRSMVSMEKPNVYDLLELHASARGTIVKNPKDADVVFSVENETPFQLETLASEFMA